MYRQRTLRRLIESCSNKKCNSFYRTLSSYQNNNINYKLLQLKNNRHIKLLTSCGHYNVPVRHLKTNIISSDNIVHSPYEDVHIPNCLLHELIWENVERWPDRTAIQCGLTGRHYTFAQIYKRAKTFAASLIKSGFKPGQLISVVLPNLPEYPIILLGGSEAGIIVSPVNPVYTSDEISFQLSNSKSVAVVTIADKVDVIKDAISKIEQKQKEPSQIKIISIQDYDGISRDCPPGVWSLREMIENDIDTSNISSVCRDHNVKSENLVILPYSSGTTGLPKGVCLTHHNIVSNVVQMSEKQCLVNQEPEGDFQDVIPVVLPFFHIYALVIILLESILHGGKIVTLPRFQPDTYIDVLNKHKNTLIYLVPPLVLFVGSHPAIKKKHFERARYVLCAAAPLGQNDIERCMAHFPEETVFKQGYGLTETSPIATIGPNFKASYSSVGPPVSLTKMKIIDVNNKKALGLEETGELCVHGPQVMKGYLNRPEATAEMIDENGWLHTGDIGYYDKNGHFYIVDRIKELIKVKGFQVAPAELEELLRCHPKVADVAVIGVPDEKAGEVPVAYIVQKPGKESVTSEKEIISYVSEKVTKYKQVKQVIFTDVIPKNPSGKILRRKLKETYTQSI